MNNEMIPRCEYPRPQFERADWMNLNGVWTYSFDFGKTGIERGWEKSTGFDSEILVPFCPESRLSGVGYTDFIHSIFYHRKVTVPANWDGKRILIHFGGVDYRCECFINGESCGVHFGGTSSFEFDITDFVKAGETCDIVVWALDDLRSNVQPTGKQSYGYKSAVCHYTRTTGIWQTVWLEAVAPAGLKFCKIIPDLDNKAFHFTPSFYAEKANRKFKISIFDGAEKVAEKTVAANSAMSVSVELSSVKTWSPECPFLYDIVYELIDTDGTVIDTVRAYAGMRKIHIEGNRIFLNNEPIFQRLVLDQGFYPEGIWTAPSDADLKKDIELSMAAGFNGARLHQKVFEERFHYWADKLGYLTWGESSSWGLCAFSGQAHANEAKEYWQSIWNFQTEWREIVMRDINHPSIITWTPLNETWVGADFDKYRRAMRAIYDQTKVLDPSRPCNETSGYHHVKTDIWTVHLYRKNVEELKESLFPADKPVYIRDGESGYNGQPYINDEFGGFMFIPPARQKFADNTWGYHGLDLKDGDELCAKIAEQVKLMLDDERCVGYCYTQLTDVEQEQNGVYNYDRTEKVSAEKLYAAFKDGVLLK